MEEWPVPPKVSIAQLSARTGIIIRLVLVSYVNT